MIIEPDYLIFIPDINYKQMMASKQHIMLFIFCICIASFTAKAQYQYSDYFQKTYIQPYCGVRAEYAEHPIFSGICNFAISNKVSANASFGGFPGVLSRISANIRYTQGSNFKQYAQLGTGINWMYQGRAEGKTVKEFHTNWGISKQVTSNISINGDLGFMLIPHYLNNWQDESTSNASSNISLTPIFGLEVIYLIPRQAFLY